MMVSRGVVLVATLCVCASFSAKAEEEKKPCKTEDGTEVQLNQQYDRPGACQANICTESGEFAVAACGIRALPTSWVLTKVDPSQGFPDCCAKPMPPLEIIPDVLDKVGWPMLWEISYGDNATVDMGNELTPTQVKEQPTVQYSSWADSQGFYLLAMVNPDAPSVINPEEKEFLHWLVGNIPGGDVPSGEVLAEYVGSGPLQETGLHRYVFVLYKQPEKLVFDETKITKTTAKGRSKFSTRKFAEKYNLGDPLAINVYQADYDDYVPTLHKQLGGKEDD